MPEPPAPSTVDTLGDKRMKWTYLAVIVVEAIVLVGLWSFSRYFG